MGINEPDDDRRIDFGALDPDLDPAAADRFVAGIMERVASRPVPRPMPVDPLIGAWSIARSPALAAGLIIAMALGALGLRLRVDDRPQTIAHAMGVPPEFLEGEVGR